MGRSFFFIAEHSYQNAHKRSFLLSFFPIMEFLWSFCDEVSSDALGLGYGEETDRVWTLVSANPARGVLAFCHHKRGPNSSWGFLKDIQWRVAYKCWNSMDPCRKKYKHFFTYKCWNTGQNSGHRLGSPLACGCNTTTPSSSWKSGHKRDMNVTCFVGVSMWHTAYHTSSHLSTEAGLGRTSLSVSMHGPFHFLCWVNSCHIFARMQQILKSKPLHWNDNTDRKYRKKQYCTKNLGCTCVCRMLIYFSCMSINIKALFDSQYE